MTLVASSIHFIDLCFVLESVSKVGYAMKRRTLTDFATHYYKLGKKMSKTDPSVDRSYFPVLRLIVPNYDRKRGPYGLQVTKFASIIISMLRLAPKSDDAIKLSNFKTGDDKIKDFADAAYWVLAKYFTQKCRISVADVNTYLDAIAEKNGNNDPRGVEEEIAKLFLACGSADTQKWIIRIILKNMKLGISFDNILNTFHGDGAEMYMRCNNLEKTCSTLISPKKSLCEMDIELFSYFRPKTGKRCNAKELISNVKGNVYFIEKKFDGERFQIHMADGQFQYFSRNGYDYTSNYGENHENGILSPRLHRLFAPHVRNCILDGEMMLWNKATKEFGSQGMTVDVKKLRLLDIHRPCFCVFDIIYLNNEVLTNKPLTYRRRLLTEILTEDEGVLLISKAVLSTTKQDLLDALNICLEKKEEGIVFKDPDSIYKPHERKAGWWKLKLEYFEGAMSDLDVIILGGYYSDGRKRSKVNSFLVGVKHNSKNEYLSFGRVSSGLNAEELVYLEQSISPHWRNSNHDDAKVFGNLWGKDVPDVWIPPDKSMVLTIRASELIFTKKAEFLTPYTLRFPRIVKIRDDKFYQECLTLQELEEITTGGAPVEKLNVSHIKLEDVENMLKKEKKAHLRLYTPPESVKVEPRSELLKNMEFCVLTGTILWHKRDVERLIREHGGDIVYTEGPKTKCILVGDGHPRVEFIKNSTKVDIDVVKLRWMINVIEKNQYTDYEPLDCIHPSKKTKLAFQEAFDKYSDSFKVLTNGPKLEDSLMECDDVPADDEEIDEEDFAGPFGVFLGLNAFFIGELTAERAKFKRHGGIISDELDEAVNIVIVRDDTMGGVVLTTANVRVPVYTIDFIHKQVACLKF